MRESLFSILAPVLPGASVLDLYAGSGALGIEALSRGAATATFVERDRRAAAVVRANLSALGYDPPRARLDVADVERWPGRGVVADLVFVDPPYDLGARSVADVLTRLRRSGVIGPTATIVIEHDRRSVWPPDGHGSLEPTRSRTYGDTMLSFIDPGRPS